MPGLAARGLVPAVLTIDMHNGVLFLCLVPSTVQSSIAFTSMARGHVSAAMVSASLSNILGVVLTPLLVVLLLMSLASRLPMALVFFPAATVGLTMLPLMIFHQIQLVVWALIASRLARESGPVAPPEVGERP